MPSKVSSTVPATLLGIGYMCLGVSCLALGDALSKWLGQSYAIIQIIFFRTLVSVPLVALLAHFRGGLGTLKTQRPWLHVWRGLFATGSMLCFIFGLTLLPLAEATAIAFAAPLFVTLLSLPLLNERVAPLPLMAALVGFGGVLIVVRPGGESFQWGAMVLLGAALCYALLMLTARRYGYREPLWAMVFYVVLVPLLVSAILLPGVWQTPQAIHWFAFLGAGILGVGTMLFITLACRLAPAALVAPFDYTAMVWAVLLGWWFWGEVPDIWVYIGSLVIIASGSLIALHERRVAIKARPTT